MAIGLSGQNIESHVEHGYSEMASPLGLYDGHSFKE